MKRLLLSLLGAAALIAPGAALASSPTQSSQRYADVPPSNVFLSAGGYDAIAAELLSALGAALIAPGAAFAGPQEGTLSVTYDLERTAGTSILEFSVENHPNNAAGFSRGGTITYAVAATEQPDGDVLTSRLGTPPR